MNLREKVQSVRGRRAGIADSIQDADVGRLFAALNVLEAVEWLQENWAYVSVQVDEQIADDSLPPRKIGPLWHVQYFRAASHGAEEVEAIASSPDLAMAVSLLLMKLAPVEGRP